MFRSNYHPLFFIVLLAMILASSMEHHVALAAAPGGDHVLAMTSTDQGSHHGSHDRCAEGDCGSHYSQSCCVMGQCMIGLPPSTDFSLPMAPLADRPIAACMAVAPGDTAPPYRPPLA